MIPSYDEPNLLDMCDIPSDYERYYIATVHQHQQLSKVLPALSFWDSVKPAPLRASPGIFANVSIPQLYP